MSDTGFGPGSFFLSRKTCAFLAYPVSGSPAPLPPAAAFESLEGEGRKGVLPVEPLRNPVSQVSSAPSLVVSDSATPWTSACQASVSITSSRSLLKLMSATQPSHPLWAPSAFWGVVLLPLSLPPRPLGGIEVPSFPGSGPCQEQPPSLNRSIPQETMC